MQTRPALDVDVREHSATIDGHRRTWTAVVPRALPSAPALLLVFHGSTQNPRRIRKATGHGFDRLAQEHGFIVAYPEAYRGAWHDCRAAAPRRAHTENIDDNALVETIIERFRASHQIDTARVFAAGFSNGGQMVFRLAAERSEGFAGLAAIGATWPTADNYACAAPQRPVAMLLMNGTRDPIVPFDGGMVTMFGFSPRGTALSAADTAAHFARHNGVTTAPTRTTLPHRASSKDTSVVLTSYLQEGRKPVLDYAVVGGGHVVPNPHQRSPRIQGPMTHDVDAPAAVWDFFAGLAGGGTHTGR